MKVYNQGIRYFNISLSNPSYEINNINLTKSFDLNENSNNQSLNFENCISYSVCTESEVVKNDNNSLELCDFIQTESDRPIPSSTPIIPEDISNGFAVVTPCKTANVKHLRSVPSPLRNAILRKTSVKPGVILPLNTKNCFPIPYENSTNCSFFESSFKFSNDEWSNMLEVDMILKKTAYPSMFKKCIRTVNNTCVINAKRVRYYKNHCSVYMYCKHEGCKNLRL